MVFYGIGIDWLTTGNTGLIVFTGFSHNPAPDFEKYRSTQASLKLVLIALTSANGGKNLSQYHARRPCRRLLTFSDRGWEHH